MYVCHPATTRKLATVSTGTMSTFLSLAPGTIRAIPEPAAVIKPDGPAKVSVHPTTGSRHVDVTIDGRTTQTGIPSTCPCRITSSAQFLVKVYVLGCRLINAGVAASATSSDAWSSSLISIAGSCEAELNASVHSIWYVWPYAVDVCTTAAQSLSARARLRICWTETMFILAAVLIGSSKRMVAATWMITDTFAIISARMSYAMPRPSSVISPGTGLILVSHPGTSFLARSNRSFCSSASTRSRGSWPLFTLQRMYSVLISGQLRRSFSTRTLPIKPVAPVMNTDLPA
mmetsp:Transcript_10312/g.31042  ORF Transcript_10312/g.31042 Transcript_10312/m.31042 type:complete len:288 (-) Transcript_10312:75-938(-)